MKKDIGFVCVGQAGGNVGSLFESKGYNVLYINTSKEDLGTLKDALHIYHIKDGEGCYKNRDAAKKLLARNIDPVINEIKSKMDNKFIFFIFAAGGGTGSGMTPFLMDILINEEFFDENDEPNKVVGCIPIIPDKSETPTAKMNACECFNEIATIEGMGNIFPLSNEIPDGYGGDYDRYKLHVNKKFVEYFDTFVSIPSNHKSAAGNIDRAEIKEMLSTYGMAVISITDKKFGMSKIVDGLKNNIFARLESSTGDRTLKYVASSTTEPLNYDTIKIEFGQFLDEFHTINQEKNIVYMCGLRLPMTVLTELRASVDAIEKDLVRSISLTTVETSKEDRLLKQIRKPRKRSRVVADPIVETGSKNDSDKGSNTPAPRASKSRRSLLDLYKQ